MKPFDLEAAKSGEPIVCRDGTPAKFVAYVPEAVGRHRVVALIEGILMIFYESGRSTESFEQQVDLFMAPKKRTVWVNLYSHGVAFNYESQHKADDHDYRITEDRIGNRAYPVEIEE